VDGTGALLIMHRRQSKDLLSWRPSMSERRLYHFVLATNAELESLLGTVDHETREKRTQSTYATGALSSFSYCILGSIPRCMPVYRSCYCLSFLHVCLLPVRLCDCVLRRLAMCCNESSKLAAVRSSHV